MNLKPIVPGRKHWQPIFWLSIGTILFSYQMSLLSLTGLSLGLQTSMVYQSMNQEINFCRPNLAFLDDELGCLMRSLKRVGSVVQKAYGGDGLTIACQVVHHSV